MVIIISFISGLIMSIGLIISGMVNPDKVTGFLDVFGQFDPTLGFVMAGGLIVTFIGYRLSGRCSKPLFCASFDEPKNKKPDAPLIIGSAIFGIGWGMAGFCPAPAIVSIGLGIKEVVVFVFCMGVGMVLAKISMKPKM